LANFEIRRTDSLLKANRDLLQSPGSQPAAQAKLALADFDALYDYIARDNPPAAAKVLRSLDRSIQLLADQPRRNTG